MADLRIICWNIQDLGIAQMADLNFEKILVEVIHKNQAHVVCILETKGCQGVVLKDALKTGLSSKTGKTWAGEHSVRSGPKSNKPEEYVFVWDTTVVTGNSFHIPDHAQDPAYPKSGYGFINTHLKSRYPYVGKFTVNARSITIVAFHTCFETKHIVNSNQNLAQIKAVIDDPNVIIMGDFNDSATGGKAGKGKKKSFDYLYEMGPEAACHYVCALDVETSLKSPKNADSGSWGTTADVRASKYDHFFWRSVTGQLSAPTATVIDVIADLRDGQYLHDLGKAAFNKWTSLPNSKGTAFGPGAKITSVQEAHLVYASAISDHLPVFMQITVN